MHHPIRVRLPRLYCQLLRLRSDKSTLIAACLERQAGFTLLCFSVDGTLGTEAGFFMCQLADALCKKWKNSNSVVMSYAKARLYFAILRALMLCVQGARARWRTFGPLDGASIDDADL